jgi:hypothetical protein
MSFAAKKKAAKKANFSVSMLFMFILSNVGYNYTQCCTGLVERLQRSKK